MTARAASALRYPIRAVARMTGLSIDTLRAWERRYEAVVPSRGDRGRAYSEADVARLKQLATLVDSGHAIGTVARLPTATLRQMLETSTEGRRADPARPDLEPLSDALQRYDLASVELTIARYAAVLSPRDLVFSIVLPVLQMVGQQWESGALGVSQEHVLSGMLRSTLGGLVRTLARPTAAERMVMATPSGERHELGLLSAAVLAASHGVGVIYLGADLPARDIGDAARHSKAAVVAVSLTTPGAVEALELRAFAALPRQLELWAGGAASMPLRAIAGDRVRYIEDLESFERTLAQRF